MILRKGGAYHVTTSITIAATRSSNKLNMLCTRSPIGRGKELKTLSVRIRIPSGVLCPVDGTGIHIRFRGEVLQVRILYGTLSPNDATGRHGTLKMCFLSVQIRFRVLCRYSRTGIGGKLRTCDTWEFESPYRYC